MTAADLINALRTGVTVVSFAVFVGIVVWAWSGRRKGHFDLAARVPLDDDQPAAPLPAPHSHRDAPHE